MVASANIPVIDLAGDESTVASELVAAAAEHGFIYIKNRGLDIPIPDVNEAFDLCRRLFDSPLEEKKRCAIRQDNHGWTGMHGETLDPKHQRIGDFKEAFNVGEFVDGKAPQPLPAPVAADEPRMSAFADSCRTLCSRILYLFGLGLGVGDFFSSTHFTRPGCSGTTLRYLRYPPSDPNFRSGEDYGAGAHSDYGSITLLFRLKGQAGLEVLRKDNAWAPVPVLPAGTEDDPAPPILLNIGDVLSYWTNGLFRSTVHRVILPTAGTNGIAGETTSGPRYSIAYFCHPMDDTRLEPVPSEKVRDYVPDKETPNLNPYAKSTVMTAEEHRMMRLKESYGTLYDEPVTA